MVAGNDVPVASNVVEASPEPKTVATVPGANGIFERGLAAFTTCVMVGGGPRLTLKTLERRPAGVTTWIEARPAAPAPAGSVASNCSLLTLSVGCANPFQRIVDPVAKPTPFTVRGTVPMAADNKVPTAAVWMTGSSAPRIAA